MIKRVFTAFAAICVVGSASAAMAMEDGDEPQPMDRTEQAPGAPVGAAPQPMMEEVAGIRIVPSIIAHDVSLSPSAWYFRAGGQTAVANSRIYVNRDGAVTGVTVTAWGLPNASDVSPRFSDYVVWLLDTDTNQMKNLGVLESRNAGKAVFGWTAEQPLSGYERIVITPEANVATAWPTGWQHLEADLPKTALLPPNPVIQPMIPVPPEQRLPMDERRMNNP